jgi:1-acyl-sn-glycerol-3-phosphate acyltransferase
VLTFWHEYNLALYVMASARRGDLRHASFTTDTPRGTVIQTIFESLARTPDQVVILRLPAEGEAAESRRLARRLGELGAAGYSLVVTPDGPWGPYREAKPGVVMVARQSGLPIVPVAVAARPALRLAGRWDRQLFPLPFSRLRLIPGEPIRVPPDGPLRPWVATVQAALETVTATAEGRLP